MSLMSEKVAFSFITNNPIASMVNIPYADFLAYGEIAAAKMKEMKEKEEADEQKAGIVVHPSMMHHG